jgi:hypothetical protein
MSSNQDSRQKCQELLPPLQVEWELGRKVLATSFKASTQKPHNEEKSVESEA